MPNWSSPMVPSSLCLQQKSRQLVVQYPDGTKTTISSEMLRQHSPSAEAPPKTIPQNINIIQIEPVGNYAVKLYFNDGHNTGIYHWDLLAKLGKMAKSTLAPAQEDAPS